MFDSLKVITERYSVLITPIIPEQRDGRLCHPEPSGDPVSDKNQTNESDSVKNIIIITVAVVVVWFIIVTIVIV